MATDANDAYLDGWEDGDTSHTSASKPHGQTMHTYMKMVLMSEALFFQWTKSSKNKTMNIGPIYIDSRRC